MSPLVAACFAPWQWETGTGLWTCVLATLPSRSTDSGALGHDLRGAWRWKLFSTWRARERRDSLACRDAVDCACARRAAMTSRNAFTVLAAFCYARRFWDQDATCPWLKQALEPRGDAAPTRPLARPPTPFRLGLDGVVGSCACFAPRFSPWSPSAPVSTSPLNSCE